MRIPLVARIKGLLAHPITRGVLRLAFYFGAACVVLFGAILLVLRLWFVPRIETYRPDIIEALTRALGQKVEVATLTAGWDGWNPTLTVTDFKIVDNSGKAVLTLPKVSNTIAWKSLFVFDLRLRTLEIERPQLQIRRDEKGFLHIAGLTIDPNEQAEDTRFGDWLLRQRRVIVRDALLLWQDDFRQAPQLVLDRVTFELDNSGSRHRFGLSGTPPAELAAPIDLRGDVRGDSFKAWQQAVGHFYVRLDYADIATWREWLPLPVPVTRGEGALRLWVDVQQGAPTQIVADVELRNLRARLRKDLPELALATVRGRVGWRGGREAREAFVEHLALRTGNGLTIEPTDLSVKLTTDGEHTTGGEASAKGLALEPWRALAVYLPLEPAWREQLARYSPRGVFEQAELRWQGDAAHPHTYAIKARVSGMGVNATDRQPGIANLSGTIDANERGGSADVASRHLALTLPGIYEQPLGFDTFEAGASWRVEQDGLKLKVGSAGFANSHAAGTASVEYHSQADGPGWIDLSAQLTRGDGRHVIDYLPLGVTAEARTWVRNSVLAGNITDAKFKLHGNLRDFPFDNDKGGVFRIDANVTDAALDYAPGWPKIEHIRGLLTFHGLRIEVSSDGSDTLGVQLGKVNVAIPDMTQTRLLVQGEAYDQTQDFLRYIEASPVLTMTDSLTEGMRANGNGRLSLQLDLPLARLADTKVNGEFEFVDDQLAWSPDMPTLDRVKGKLYFSEKELRASGITAEMLGGPANIVIGSTAGRVQVTARGTADLAALRKRYSMGLARQLSGRTDWLLNLNLRHNNDLQWTLESSLKGAVLDLPAPFAKAANENVALKVVKVTNDRQPDLLVANYGRLAQLQVRRSGGPKTSIDRVALSFNDARVEPDRPGLWLSGRLDHLDADRWLALQPWQWAGGETIPASLPLGGSDLQIGSLTLFGKRFADLRVGAGTQEQTWQLQLQSAEVAGTVSWSASTVASPNGKIVARLQRLKIPATAGAEASAKKVTDAAVSEAKVRSGWPAVDFVAESMLSKDRELGKLELQAHPDGADWAIERFALGSPDGSLQASGRWHTDPRNESTTVDVAINVKDASGYLGRFGYPNAVKGAATTLKGQLSWQGGPQDFDYPSLNGELNVDTKKGQFTKIDPGLGKLLGVLSLQSLPRRISLDFRDVFSEGFAFDEIAGDVHIKNGVMRTDDFKLVGPAAHVELTGEANLAAETQNLKVKVMPSLSTGVSLGAALVVNPLVGGALLLGQKALKDPIERMFAYEYRVTGTWSDPHVEKKTSAFPVNHAPGE